MKNYSPNPKIKYTNLSHYLHSSLTSHSDSILWRRKMEFYDRKFSYSEAWKIIRHVNGYLNYSGIHQGDSVIIWGYNSPEWSALYLACLLRGVVVVPANVLATVAVAQKYADSVQPKAAFISEGLEGKISGIPNIRLEELFNLALSIHSREFDLDLDDSLTAEIMFTSGTTGDPKGVVLTRGNITKQVATIPQVFGLNPNPSILSILPYSHIFEQIISLLYPLQYGITINYLNYLTVENIQECLITYKPEYLVVVPEIVEAFSKKISQTLSKLKLAWMLDTFRGAPQSVKRVAFKPVLAKLGGNLHTISIGGAKSNPASVKLMMDIGIQVIEGYGLTETTAPVTLNIIDYPTIGKVGRPMPGVELKLDESGEVAVKSDVVFPGYFNRPELNSEIFTDEGFFKTGDIGELDSDGYLRLKGRQKYRIVLANGEKVYPEDIEQVVKQVKGIDDITVFAYDLNDHTQIVAAAVIPESVETTDKEIAEMIAEANQKLEINQRIAKFARWPKADFPKTATKKVIRDEVKQEIVHHFMNPEAEAGKMPSAQESGIDPKVLRLIS